PKGIATTVIDGAKVGETPVQITDKGIVVADKTNPLNQEQVNKAMADNGYPQVRLLPSIAKAGEDGSSVTSAAGTLEFVKQDEKFGASNPQGFSGGGFSIGGAEAIVTSRRCETECPGGDSSSDIVGGDTGSAPLSGDTSSSESTAGSDSLSSDSSSVTGGGSADAGGYGASSTGTLTTDTSGVGLGGSSTADTGGGLSSGATGSGSGSTTAVTPSNGQAAAGVSTPGAGVAVQQQAAAYTELGPKSAEWLRDLYLMAALALGIIFVGQRLARAFA
ncbi:MAG: hypothetical protein ACRDYF_07570, partial [Acidimicrobiia bacterium]